MKILLYQIHTVRVKKMLKSFLSLVTLGVEHNLGLNTVKIKITAVATNTRVQQQGDYRVAFHSPLLPVSSSSCWSSAWAGFGRARGKRFLTKHPW